ncbi:MAG: ABC transporter ATP-binding protein [Oscillospiraceae bacterium]
MIKATALTKRFEDTVALQSLTTEIEKGSIYGLVGSNGAGKSTLLRLIAGIYQPDEGSIQIDGVEIFENEALKDKIFFLADELFFFQGATMDKMAEFYKGVYINWSDEVYKKLSGIFPISSNKRIAGFSKGMQRQAALVLALSTCPEILMLDEAFDGLDPVIRNLLRRILADDVATKGTTVIISSHNLRELEDLCDQVGVLHGGKILFQREIDDLKLGFCKLQAAFKPAITKEAFSGIELLEFETKGSMVNLIARGNKEDIIAEIKKLNPLFVEAVGLTLEEIFIHEMEAVGYDYSNIIF